MDSSPELNLGFTRDSSLQNPNEIIKLKRNESIYDRYTTPEKVGDGTFGVVVAATCKENGQKRAIKSISKARTEKENDANFTEIQILQRISHPGILKLFEAIEDDNNYYLVTDYLSGGELFDYAIESKCLTESVAASIFIQLVEAIKYLHKQRIIHRDIKPENILLVRKPKSYNLAPTIKLIDFGTAVILQEQGEYLKHKVGSAYYMAPEVIDGNYDEKCDIWSCGVILYILLCGYPPFNGSSDKEIMKKVKAGQYVFDPVEWSKVSEEAQDLIRNILVIDPQQRYKSSQILRHPWVESCDICEKVEVNTLTAALAQLTSFNASRRLQMAVTKYITSQLIKEDEVKKLRAMFIELDSDKSGEISYDELKKGYNQMMGNSLSQDELQVIIEAIDEDGSGQISYEEFVPAMVAKSTVLDRENLQIAFNLFDTDGSGTISVEEIRKLLGGTENDAQLMEIIQEVDIDGDGEIDIEEFTTMMVKVYEPDI